MKKKILIIDDYKPLLDEVSEFLELEDFHVITAKNGAEGVQKAILNEPDMIICDILMPELDGYQVFETISQIPVLATTPFIFLTARATADDYRKGLDLGVDDYLTKPFTIDALLTAIKRRFDKVEKYKSVRKEVVEFLFSNPLLGVFIYADETFLYQNEASEKIVGYKLSDINSVELSELIIGNVGEIQKELSLIKAGVHKSFETDLGFIKKDKSTIYLKLFIKSILFDGKNSYIGCLIEKEQYSNQADVAPSVEKFLDFLSSNNNKEISDEISLLYNKMKVEENVKQTSNQKRLKISKREKEVLELICKGYTNKEIADKLFLSARTVDNHRANMLTKTGTKNTAELVAYVVKNKLINI